MVPLDAGFPAFGDPLPAPWLCWICPSALAGAPGDWSWGEDQNKVGGWEENQKLGGSQLKYMQETV